MKRIEFRFPQSNEPDYYEMQKIFSNYEESTFVDDYIEVKNIIREYESIDPNRVQDELIPQLQKLIEESNGRLDSFYVWPQYLPGGMEKIYPDGRRYPKRLKEYKHHREDKTIFLNGVDIGYMKPTVLYLHTDIWKGQAISL